MTPAEKHAQTIEGMHENCVLNSQHCGVTASVAVKFGDWVTNCGYSIEGGVWFDYSPIPMTDISKGITTEELFEIFKKEQNL